MDIGVGANCVYPIIGNSTYGWSFIGTDIDSKGIEAAQKIVTSNPSLHGKVEFRLQQKPEQIFSGILKVEEKVDFTICNPPFHATQAEAEAGTLRKLSNLKKKRRSCKSKKKYRKKELKKLNLISADKVVNYGRMVAKSVLF